MESVPYGGQETGICSSIFVDEQFEKLMKSVLDEVDAAAERIPWFQIGVMVLPTEMVSSLRQVAKFKITAKTRYKQAIIEQFEASDVIPNRMNKYEILNLLSTADLALLVIRNQRVNMTSKSPQFVKDFTKIQVAELQYAEKNGVLPYNPLIADRIRIDTEQVLMDPVEKALKSRVPNKAEISKLTRQAEKQFEQVTSMWVDILETASALSIPFSEDKIIKATVNIKEKYSVINVRDRVIKSELESGKKVNLSLNEELIKRILEEGRFTDEKKEVVEELADICWRGATLQGILF